MHRWVGKTAVVTGASSGIGAAISVELANAGVNVIGLARKTGPIEARFYSKHLLSLINEKET